MRDRNVRVDGQIVLTFDSSGLKSAQELLPAQQLVKLILYKM